MVPARTSASSGDLKQLLVYNKLFPPGEAEYGKAIFMDYIPRATLERPLRRLSAAALRDRLQAVRALAAVRGMRYSMRTSRPMPKPHCSASPFATSWNRNHALKSSARVTE